MVTETNTQTDYRYPGIRPFYDNDIDRRLFFGRDTEKEALLHKVLADNLVVLYARSGLGKTSLLNAGLNQALRDRGFIPLMVRFNDAEPDPVQGIYAGIEEIAGQVSMEVEAGEDTTLWQYFKTTYFWSDSNKILTPVLILDQFEEFFTLYSSQERKGFIRQLADVVNNKIPASLLESVEPEEPLPYSDNPPNVKVIISIREDYVGQLDEMSREIPDILHHRFRLLPLSREQARQAIIKPSQVQDDVIGAVAFTFAAEAVDMMLDFLCERRERGVIKKTDEVESFQLQLLCRHIEDMVHERTKNEPGDMMVKKKDLGGEPGMQRVLQRFYDDQVKKLDTLWKRRKARRLCEKGLISLNDLRLSLEEGEIKRKFKASENLLVELVNSRLLRAEPRVGSVYYELSHDTLVAPVRESQRKRKSKRTKIGFGIFLICVIIIMIFFIERNYRKSQEINKLKVGMDALSFRFSGDKKYYLGKFDEAILNYEKAILIYPEYPDAYNVMGNAYYRLKKYNEAIDAYKKAIEIDPKEAAAYNNMGNALSDMKKYNEAMDAYKKAINIDPNYDLAYFNLGILLNEQKKYDDAIEAYLKATEIDPKYAEAYNNMGNANYCLKKNTNAIAAYQKAITINPKYAHAYYNMGIALGKQGKYNDAISAYQKAIKIGPKDADYYYGLGYTFDELKKYKEAIGAYKKALEIKPDYKFAYDNIILILSDTKRYKETIELYQRASMVAPNDINAEISFAEVYLIAKDFNMASSLANDLLKENNISTQHILAIRCVSIFSLIFQGKQPETATQLKDFIKYYKTIPGEYERGWEYNTIKTFIIQYKKLPPKQKKLLLQLIDLLESPKKEGDKKLKELEISIWEVFK
jgi:tetratricopeptide (TPR) repeat protein